MTPALRASTSQPLRGLKPSAGIFYVVPTPKEWALLAWRYDDYPEEADHTFFWETEACPFIANAWAVILNPNNSGKPRAKLISGLLPHYSAFPRGRTSHGPKGLTIYWGENFPSGAEVLRPVIVEFFGLTANTRWERDDHELCIAHDYQAVRKILPIRAGWSTT